MSGNIVRSAMEPPRIISSRFQPTNEVPPLPSRTGQSSRKIPPTIPPQLPLSPAPCIAHRRSNCSEEECKNGRQDIVKPVLQNDQYSHHYDQVTVKEDGTDDVLLKLKKMEDNQTRLRNELDDFRVKVVRDIGLLQASVNRVQEITDTLEDFTRDSLTRLETSIKNVNIKLLEISHQLGSLNSGLEPSGKSLEAKHLKKYKPTSDKKVGDLY